MTFLSLMAGLERPKDSDIEAQNILRFSTLFSEPLNNIIIRSLLQALPNTLYLDCPFGPSQVGRACDNLTSTAYPRAVVKRRL